MAEMSSVLFIILDGTRRDRLSLFGHARETSPNLDEFTEDAIIFDNAYTPGPWSLPAHTSMLTGLYPSEHGMTNVFSNESVVIPDGMETMADTLSDRGYRTGGFSNNPWLGRTSGLDDRFDLFLEWDLEFSTAPDDWSLTTWERRHSKLHRLLAKVSGQPLALLKDDFFVSRALSSAERWLINNSDPTYAFVNLMGAHTPYYPSKAAFDSIGVDRPSPLELRRIDIQILRDSIHGEGLATTQTERIREIYDASIRTQDEALGHILDTLKSEGRYDESLIIVAADHGKTLGEFDRHGDPTHYMFDINVNVPLVVKPPNHSKTVRIEEPFELVNLYEFLADGEYSQSWLEAQTTPYAFVEDFTPHTGAKKKSVTEWRAITDGEVKYIVNNEGQEWFTRGTGPSEALVDTPDFADEFRQALDDRLNKLDEVQMDHESTTIDGDVESQLKELGYLN